MQTVTKVDQDFDIRRVEGVADKYVPKSNTPKRPAKNWPKVNWSIKSVFLFYISVKLNNIINKIYYFIA